MNHLTYITLRVWLKDHSPNFGVITKMGDATKIENLILQVKRAWEDIDPKFWKV